MVLERPAMVEATGSGESEQRQRDCPISKQNNIANKLMAIKKEVKNGSDR